MISSFVTFRSDYAMLLTDSRSVMSALAHCHIRGPTIIFRLQTTFAAISDRPTQPSAKALKLRYLQMAE